MPRRTGYWAPAQGRRLRCAGVLYIQLMLEWPAEGVSRAPYRVMSDPEIYALEQERIFRGPVWNYLCLEAELPEPGSFRTAAIGDTPILVARNKDGVIGAMVNRCAHKGA